MIIHVVDIDGTISDNSHRYSVLTKTCVVCGGPMGSEHRAKCESCGSGEGKIPQHQWDMFMDPVLLMKDAPIYEAERVLTKYYNMGHQIHFLTGRSERLREATEAWLLEHFCFPEAQLYMRGLHFDGVSASDYKEMQLENLLDMHNPKGDHSIIFYEDDPYVMGMYAKHGIVMKAPDCWHFLMPEGFNRKVEPAWNV